MKNLLGFLILIIKSYGVKVVYPNSVRGTFKCSQAMIGKGEIGIWNGIHYENYSENETKNEAYFIWEFPVNIQTSSFDQFNSIKLKFQYRIQNLIPEFNDQNVDLIVKDHNKNILLNKKIEQISEDFQEIKINLDKKQFLDACNENNQYILAFETSAFGYQHIEAPVYSALSIQIENENKVPKMSLTFKE